MQLQRFCRPRVDGVGDTVAGGFSRGADHGVRATPGAPSARAALIWRVLAAANTASLENSSAAVAPFLALITGNLAGTSLIVWAKADALGINWGERPLWKTGYVACLPLALAFTLTFAFTFALKEACLGYRLEALRLGRLHHGRVPVGASLVHDLFDNVANGVFTVPERGYPHAPLGLVGFHKPREASAIRDIGRG